MSWLGYISQAAEPLSLFFSDATNVVATVSAILAGIAASLAFMAHLASRPTSLK